MCCLGDLSSCTAAVRACHLRVHRVKTCSNVQSARLVFDVVKVDAVTPSPGHRVAEHVTGHKAAPAQGVGTVNTSSIRPGCQQLAPLMCELLARVKV